MLETTAPLECYPKVSCCRMGMAPNGNYALNIFCIIPVTIVFVLYLNLCCNGDFCFLVWRQNKPTFVSTFFYYFVYFGLAELKILTPIFNPGQAKNIICKGLCEDIRLIFRSLTVEFKLYWKSMKKHQVNFSKLEKQCQNICLDWCRIPFHLRLSSNPFVSTLRFHTHYIGIAYA